MAAITDFAGERELTILAPAKINLFLEVLGRRQDGYHEIDTVMQTVGLFDRLRLRYDPAGKGVTLSCQKKFIPTDSSNAAVACAERFLEATGAGGGLSIVLEKRIPVAAGLGGGSTDGAAVLRGLNALTGAGLSVDELCRIGKSVGADVPFCIRGGCARATGIGEIFSDCPSLRGCTALIAIGKRGSSTPAAYKALDEAGYTGGRSAQGMIDALRSGEFAHVKAQLYNAFEPSVEAVNEEVTLLKRRMPELGADAVMMSGSGASVFGLFSGKGCARRAEKACAALRAEGFFAMSAHVPGANGRPGAKADR